MAEEYRRHIGDHHTERRPRGDRDDGMILRAERDRRYLRLVPHLDQKEGDERRQEGTEAWLRRIISVELVGDQRPRRHRDKRHSDRIAEDRAVEERRRRRAEQRRERMIGERRDQYAKDDRQRLSKTRRKQDCEQLRLRSEEHTSELQSLMRTSYAVFCL